MWVVIVAVAVLVGRYDNGNEVVIMLVRQW